MAGFESDLDRANKKLDKVQIRQVGQRLYLRATLPDKTDPNRNVLYHLRLNVAIQTEFFQSNFCFLQFLLGYISLNRKTDF